MNWYKISQIQNNPFCPESKVVDSNGNLLTVYHGTSSNFRKFNLKKSTMGLIWFTSNKENIESGESGATGRNIIKAVNLCIKNPAGWNEYKKYSIMELKSLGYDGIILDDNYVVFNPSQIKIINQNLIKKDNRYIQIFRGKGPGTNKNGNFWTTNAEFAAQFTRTGRMSELRKAKIRISDIYDIGNKKPYAGDVSSVDKLIKEAKSKGFKAVILNEGSNQPDSIYIFDLSSLN